MQPRTLQLYTLNISSMVWLCSLLETYQRKNNINEQQQNQKQTHRHSEQTDGFQRIGGVRDWMRNMEGLRITDGNLKVVTGM